MSSPTIQYDRYDPTRICIVVQPSCGGRYKASLVGPSVTPHVAYETSVAAIDRGDDGATDAVASLRRVYDRLPADVPVVMVDSPEAAAAIRWPAMYHVDWQYGLA